MFLQNSGCIPVCKLGAVSIFPAKFSPGEIPPPYENVGGGFPEKRQVHNGKISEGQNKRKMHSYITYTC